MKSNLLFYPHYCLFGQTCASVSELTINGTRITTTLSDNTENKLTLSGTHEDLLINQTMFWPNSKGLFISSESSIVFGSKGSITNYGNGTIYLHSGVDGLIHNGTLVFPHEESEYIKSLGGGEVIITYNPEERDGNHKYNNPQSFAKYISKNTKITSYMLVHNAQDLQDINKFPSGNYALSQDIDLSLVSNFKPIGTKDLPFTGHFNGNGHTIGNLHVESKDNFVGLFGVVIGQHPYGHAVIKDLTLSNCTVTGNQYVGLLLGRASAAKIENVKIIDGKVEGHSIVGGIGGTASYLSIKDIEIKSISSTHTSLNETDIRYTGTAFGALGKSNITSSLCEENSLQQCIGHIQEVEFF
jgi:hypothetical protein